MSLVSKALVSYTLKAAIRDRLVRVVVALFAIIASISLFMGSTAVLEPNEFSITFAASSLRLATIMGLILFISFYLQRSAATKDLDFLLSRPISRECFVLSHSIAFMVLSLLTALFATLVLCVLSQFQWGAGLTAWGIGMIVEAVIMVNAAMFFSMVLTSAVATVSSSFGFYILARMTGALFGTIDAQQDGQAIGMLENIMQGITMILPRFDLIVQSSWLVYGTAESYLSYPLMFASMAAFSALIIFATIIDLKRKEF